ncbi:MAG: hypothetical protein ACRELG_07840 [Gemmataceae bacterium]
MPLDPYATAVFSQVGQQTAFLLNGSFYGDFYRGATLVRAAPSAAAIGVAAEEATSAAGVTAEILVPGSTGARTNFVSDLAGK